MPNILLKKTSNAKKKHVHAKTEDYKYSKLCYNDGPSWGFKFKYT